MFDDVCSELAMAILQFFQVIIEQIQLFCKIKELPLVVEAFNKKRNICRKISTPSPIGFLNVYQLSINSIFVTRVSPQRSRSGDVWRLYWNSALLVVERCLSWSRWSDQSQASLQGCQPDVMSWLSLSWQNWPQCPCSDTTLMISTVTRDTTHSLNEFYLKMEWGH